MTHKSPTQPLCHYCGKPIAKHTHNHYVGGSADRIKERLYNKADCQRQVNDVVVHVRYAQDYDWNTDKHVGPRYVSHFSTWDGESYEDEFFCNNTCAMGLAYVMARAGRCTNFYNEAKARQNAKLLTERSN